MRPGDLFLFERQLWDQKIHPVCGIDEVGRGPLAGPVVAAAVILPQDFHHDILTDSKKLTAARRESLYAELTSRPEIVWSVAVVDSGEIDQINILRATWKAMVAAREGLAVKPDWTLVDGLKVPPLGKRQTAIVGGDGKSFSIAAASVIAKVLRDRMMVDWHAKYPAYGFDGHKGYGTRTHLEALQKWGPCPIHRCSFEPVAAMTQKEKVSEQFLFPGAGGETRASGTDSRISHF